MRAIILVGEKLFLFFLKNFPLPPCTENCKGCQHHRSSRNITHPNIFNIFFFEKPSNPSFAFPIPTCRFSTSFTFDREAQRERDRTTIERIYIHIHIHARIYRKNKRKGEKRERGGAGIEAVCSPGILANYRRQRSQFENQCHPPPMPRDRRYGVTSVHTEEAIPWNGIA